MAEGTETSEEMTAGRLGGVWVADLDNRLPAMEFATRMPPIPISTIPSPRMGSARQEESPDISPEVETEDPNEMVDSSSLNSVKDIPSIPSFIPLCDPTLGGVNSVAVPFPLKSTMRMKRLSTGNATYLMYPREKSAQNLPVNYHDC